MGPRELDASSGAFDDSLSRPATLYGASMDLLFALFPLAMSILVCFSGMGNELQRLAYAAIEYGLAGVVVIDILAVLLNEFAWLQLAFADFAR